MGSSINSTKIWDLMAERNKLLEEHPELRPLQDEIDRRMNGAGSQHNRMVILQGLMQDKLSELQEKWSQLGSICEEVLETEAKLKVVKDE